MATITLDEIERHHPDVLLPPDAEFAECSHDTLFITPSIDHPPHGSVSNTIT